MKNLGRQYPYSSLIRFRIVCLLLFLSLQSAGQFKESNGYDWGIIGGALTARVIYTIEKSKFKSSEPFKGNGVPNILWFDRSALSNSSYRAAQTSDGFLYTSLAGMAFNGVHGKQGWYLGLETMAVTDITNLLIKNIVRRKRPFTYNSRTLQTDRSYCSKYDASDYDASLSFYSGHTAQVAAFSYLTLSMLWYTSTSFQEGNHEWAFILGGAIPSITGYLRVRAGKHFPTDVIVGYMLGAASGYFIPKWHREGSEMESSSSLNDRLGISLISGAGSGILFVLISKIVGKPKHQCLIEDAQLLNRTSKVNFSVKPQIGLLNGLKMALNF